VFGVGGVGGCILYVADNVGHWVVLDTDACSAFISAPHLG